MWTSRLPSSFHDIYSLSMSSLRRKALCIVINFLFLWSICLGSFFYHFKSGPVYLTRGSAQVFVSLKRFLLQFGFGKLYRSSEILFCHFFFLLVLFDVVRFQYSQVSVIFLFSAVSDSFLIILLLVNFYTSVC